MLPRTYDNQVCSIARTLERIGDRWTMLIIRDAFLGVRRFDDFQRDLGVARNVLADRLGRLVEAGILERVPYQQRPTRYDYRLTAMGRELGVPVISLMHWGDRHLADQAGPPRLTRHHDCGGDVVLAFRCTTCGANVPPGDVDVVPGPGLGRPDAAGA
jgi:DNA-binding HxlR family transcriptional regulator